jgi:hypothetical protein
MYYLTFSLDTKQHIDIYRTTNSRNDYTDQILHTKKINIEKLKSSMVHEQCR